MNAQWRLFLAALGMILHGTPVPGAGEATTPHEACRFIPLVGICIGLLAAGVYWAAAQIWPTSVAVVLSMSATAMITARDAPRSELGAVYSVFVLLIKYNALMALSAASVPFPLPAYGALGLIMVTAHAASRGLSVSVMAGDSPSGLRVTTGDLVVALGLGLAPAVLLGIPGLIGLVGAILMRLGLSARALQRVRAAVRERLEIIQQLTELSFYLGALASWKYV